MKTIEQFYRELRNNVQRIDQCKFWDEYDWSNEGYESSSVMTAIAKEISCWNTKSDYGEFATLFQIIENGFVEYDVKTSSYLATDFLVTIMEIDDKFNRDEIKKFMKDKTQENYRQMLKFYREL